MNKNVIDIVYSTDKKYLSICSTSMISLFSNNKNFEKINIHILTLDLSSHEIEKFNILAKKFKNVYFYFYHLNELIKKYTIHNQGYSLAGYLRIFIKSVLPQEIEKILYLDGDTLITGDLSELWNMDLGENICGGVLDSVTLDAKTRIGLKEYDNYFNAGVLLINLKKWKEENIESKLLYFLNINKGNVFHHDQGLVNAVIREWKELPAKFNTMSVYMFFKRKQLIKIYDNNQICSESEIREAKINPTIIHDKLWANFWIHPYKKMFQGHNANNPFGRPLDRIKLSQKIHNWIQHILPFFLYAPLWKLHWKRKIDRKGQV